MVDERGGKVGAPLVIAVIMMATGTRAMPAAEYVKNLRHIAHIDSDHLEALAAMEEHILRGWQEEWGPRVVLPDHCVLSCRSYNAADRHTETDIQCLSRM